MSLLQSGIVPKRFWFTLLTDALPLLNLEEVSDCVSEYLSMMAPTSFSFLQLVFSADDTYTLSHCLQQLTSSHSSSPHDSKMADPLSSSPDSKVTLLRVALCRNLARATLEEAL